MKTITLNEKGRIKVERLGNEFKENKKEAQRIYDETMKEIKVSYDKKLKDIFNDEDNIEKKSNVI